LLVPCRDEDHDGDCTDHKRWDDDSVTPSVSAPATARAAVAPHSPHSLTAEDGDATWRARLTRQFASPAR
jgi:hypothetical protein